MKKEIYIYRDMETQEIEDLLILPIWSNHDEERTWFYYEWIIDLNDIIKLIK